MSLFLYLLGFVLLGIPLATLTFYLVQYLCSGLPEPSEKSADADTRSLIEEWRRGL